MTYSIIQADLKEHREAILGLWERNFQDMPEERYSWIYEGNPAGSAACCIARDPETGSVIGAASLFPRRILVNGKCFIAGIAGDFAIDRKHRGFGPAASLQKMALSFCASRKFDILYGFPSKQAVPVTSRAGCKMLGEIFTLTKPLRSHYHLKKYHSMPLLAKMIAKPVDIIMEYSSMEKYSGRIHENSFEILPSFDRRFDDLWEKASVHFPIIGERSSAYLLWRFTRSPHRKYAVFTLVQDNGDMSGYIVFSTSENKTVIVDLLSLDLQATLSALLSGFITFQRKEGIDSISISFTGNRYFLKKLKRYGFFLRSKEGRVIIYLPPDSPHLSFLLDKKNWYLLPGDNDI